MSELNLFIISSFSLVFILITIIIGASITRKYFVYDSSIFLIIGFAWIGTSFPWLPEVFKFFFLIFQPNVEAIFLIMLYFSINIISMPLFLTLLIYGLNQLITSIKDIVKKAILGLTLILVFIFEIIIFVCLVADYNLLLDAKGVNITLYSVYWGDIITVFQILFLIPALITALIFAWESLQSNNPEVNLKGKFLFIAFISLAIAATLDALFTIDTSHGLLLKIIARVLLMSCSVEFFLGFILPERIKERLL